MSASLINRTMKTNIVLYRSNGKGRDSYIIYNNGGFWKNINPVIQKDFTYRPTHKPNNHSPGKPPSIWTYRSDGSGRDSYILYNGGGLIKKFKSMAEKLNNFLRSNDNNDDDSKVNMSFVNRKKPVLLRDEKLYLKKIHKIQKDLVNRLYNNNTSLRKKIFCKNVYKSAEDNNSFDLKNKMFNKNEIIFEKQDIKKNLNKSSSSIYKKKYLEPIKDNINNKSLYNSLFKNKNKLILNKKLTNSKSMRTIVRNNLNINNDMNIKNIKKFNLKRKFLYNAWDNNKLSKYPKIFCD